MRTSWSIIGQMSRRKSAGAPASARARSRSITSAVTYRGSCRPNGPFWFLPRAWYGTPRRDPGNQPGFLPGRKVAQGAVGLAHEPAATADGEQRHVVEEVEAHTAQDHRFARGYGVQRHVGRVARCDVPQAVPIGELAQGRFGLAEVMRHVAECEHHGLQVADGLPGVQYDFLQAIRGVTNVDRGRLVRCEADRRGRRPDDAVARPLQIAPVERPGRIVVRPERRRLRLERPPARSGCRARRSSGPTRRGSARSPPARHSRRSRRRTWSPGRQPCSSAARGPACFAIPGRRRTHAGRRGG